MEELYFYLDKVKEELDKSEVMTSLIKKREEVYNNQELIDLIKLYNENKSDKLRKGIY